MFYHRWALSNESNRNSYVIEWLANLAPNHTLLDAGAGTKRYKPYASHLKYTSQDFGGYTGGESFGHKLAPHWDSTDCDLICDIASIPVDDGSFDYILCTEVFEHLPNPHDALKELARVLKQGGSMLITAPFRSLYHQEPYFFYSGFSKYWYEHYSELFDLDILSIQPNGNYITDISQEILRLILVGSPMRKLFAMAIAFPFLCYLFILDKFASPRLPESCWGYHVLLTKR